MTEDMEYDKGDHYSNSMSDAHPGVQMAGDVISMPINPSAAGGQDKNKESLNNIGIGKATVDKTNLVLGPGMRKPR